MDTPTEQELIRGAQRFDLDTLAVIYDRYSPGVYRYAVRLLGDDSMAEDCVADTFSRFLKALRAGQGPRDHLQAYLYRIAHNWITDSYRRQPLPPLELDESLPDGDHSLLEKQADARIEQQQVRTALSALTPDQRQVVVLRFIEGWENEEVAGAMQKPVGAIKALQHRALTALRKYLLQEEGVVADESEK
jgi:RNA polymerase sigma-70 factor (ECF subfamily)